VLLLSSTTFAAKAWGPWRQISNFNTEPLELAIHDFTQTHGEAYKQGSTLLTQLSSLELRIEDAHKARTAGTPWTDSELKSLVNNLYRFKRKALLSNPLLKDLQIICVKRNWKKNINKSNMKGLGLTSNHECKSSLARTGYKNELAIFNPHNPSATWKTLHRPEDTGWVGEIDLHWHAEKLLFTKSENGVKRMSLGFFTPRHCAARLRPGPGIIFCTGSTSKGS
jgi:hypothetical protein